MSRPSEAPPPMIGTVTLQRFDGQECVCIQLERTLLVMSPHEYDCALTRGKLLKRHQANEARMTKARAREEAAQLNWIDQDMQVPRHVPDSLPGITCAEATPCCERRNEYNGFASGPTLFTCPRNCTCHD